MSAIRRANGGYFPNNWLQHALNEIYQTYGYRCEIDRKSLHKFGRYTNLGTSEALICHNGVTPVGFGDTHASTNSLTHLVSSDNSDTQTITVEGMTISGGVYTFSRQTKALTGTTPVALDTPIAVCTRIQNNASSTPTAGDVTVHDNASPLGIGNVMPQADQSTLFAGTAVAGNNYLILTHGYAHVAKKTDAYVDFRLKGRTTTTSYHTSEVVACSRNSSGIFKNFEPYRIIPPNSDIVITATANTTGVDVCAGFYGVFADIVA